MRKFYLLALAALLTLSTFAEVHKILVVDNKTGQSTKYIVPVVDEDTVWLNEFLTENHCQMLADVINSHDSLEAVVKPLDSCLSTSEVPGVTEPWLIWSDYDGIIITEAMGSSDAGKLVEANDNAGNLWDSVGLDLPSINLKFYGIRDSKPGWKWLPAGDLNADKALFDTADPGSNTAYETTMILDEADAIFGGYDAGEEIVLFNNLAIHSDNDFAHLQACTFENSDSSNVVNAMTQIGTSLNYSENSEGASGLMFKKEAHLLGDGVTEFPRSVLWGIHAMFTEPTDDMKKIFLNSVLWSIGMDPINFTSADETFVDNAFSVYPNPANNQLTISLNEAVKGAITVTLHDVTGKLVLNNEYTSSIEPINVANLASGIYICTVVTEDIASTQRVIIK